MKLKFIYWFAFYDLYSPTVRYRAKYPLDFLKKNYGIGSYFVYPSYNIINIIRFVIIYSSALVFRKKNSLIVVQSVNSNFLYANALKLLVRLRNKNTVYDLDDADYLRFPPSTIYYFIKHCRTVTVGSSELLKNLSGRNANTVLITCPVPDLKMVKQNRNTLLTLGWIGEFTGGHKESMVKFFFPSLAGLPFKIKLVLLGVIDQNEHQFLKDYFGDFSNVTLEIPQNIAWKNEEEIQKRIMEFDAGIATLLDTEFYRSKSAFKAKQYLNNGIPVLSSDIPENNLFVKHGENGFFCSTPSDFRQRIIELNSMGNSQYNKLSVAARQSIYNFNLDKFSADFIKIFN